MDDYRIPRLVFIWMLLAQAFLLLPHIIRTPGLLIPAWLLCSCWRIMIYRGRWQYPSALVKAVMVLLAVLAVYAIEQNIMRIEAMVLLLLIAFLLKVLEMKTLRDLLISVYLAYFVIVTQLLFEQGIVSALYLVAALALVTTVLTATYSSQCISFFSPLRESGKMLLFSLPLMVVAFLVFPRIEPLWTLPSPSAGAKTGISDTMSPGSVSSLAESDALAFRVEFTGTSRALPALYWRGLVLQHFDGSSWRQHGQVEPVADAAAHYLVAENEPVYHYQLVMEPSQQQWMFTLPGTVDTDADSRFYADYTFRHQRSISSRQSWQFTAYPFASRPQLLDEQQLRLHRQLPSGYNPQTRALAEQLRAVSTSDLDYLERLMAYFAENSFVYTMTPPLLGRHSVDDFLFSSKRGFCEHYASAFTVLARAANIPARVVIGYQGGDINPIQQTITVRQLDAHAWTEVWLPDRGWVRFDPTYAVAPERIEQGGQLSLRNEERFLAQSPMSTVRFPDISWVRRLQYRFDYMNYLWHVWVLSYEGRKQQDVLRQLFGEISWKKTAMILAAAFVFTALLIWICFYIKHRKPPPSRAEKLYRHFLRKLGEKDIKSRTIGPQALSEQAMQHYPENGAAIDDISQQYMMLMYSKMSSAEYQRRLKHLRQSVRGFRSGRKSRP